MGEWNRVFGDDRTGHHAAGVVTGPGGDVWLATSHEAGALPDFGEGPQPQRGHAALSRFSRAGDHRWTFAVDLSCRPSCSTLSYHSAEAVAVHPSGRAALAANFGEEGDYGPTIIRRELYVAVVNASGEQLWKRKIAAPAGDAAVFALDFDDAGNVFVSGHAFGSGWDFGDGVKRGHPDRWMVFVGSYSPSGAVRFVRTYSHAQAYSRGGAMAANADGSFVLAGGVVGTLSFGEHSVAGQPMREGEYVPFTPFVASFDAAGRAKWARTFGNSSVDPTRLATSGGGLAIAITGSFHQSWTFAGSAIANSGAGRTHDGYVAVFNADGTERWGFSYGGPADDRGSDVTFNGAGMVYFTGHCEGACSVRGTAFSGSPEHRRRAILGKADAADGKLVSARSVFEDQFVPSTFVAANSSDVFVGGTDWVPNRDDCEGCSYDKAYLRRFEP